MSLSLGTDKAVIVPNVRHIKTGTLLCLSLLSLILRTDNDNFVPVVPLFKGQTINVCPCVPITFESQSPHVHRNVCGLLCACGWFYQSHP